MSATIKIDNFGSLNIKELGQVDVDAAAAQANVTLKSSANFLANDYVVIGRRGTEPAELKQILSVAAAVVTLTANLSYLHSRFEPFTSLFGNKIRVYRAPNVDGSQPADGAFTLLSTTDIDVDQAYTSVVDAAGSDQYWYKFTYYNSTTTDETNLADSAAARGGGANSYCSIDDIRQEAGLVYNQFITDSQIDTKRQAAQAEVNSALVGVYTVPFVAPINPLIQQITAVLAAGMILLEDYGPMNNLSTANGQALVDKARDLLNKLDTKKLVLIDSAGADTSVPGSANSYSGWPNASTADADPSEGGNPRSFRTSDRY